MDCPKCLGPVEPTQRFCNWCGTPLTDAGATAPASVPPPPAVEAELASSAVTAEVSDEITASTMAEPQALTTPPMPPATQPIDHVDQRVNTGELPATQPVNRTTLGDQPPTQPIDHVDQRSSTGELPATQPVQRTSGHETDADRSDDPAPDDDRDEGERDEAGLLLAPPVVGADAAWARDGGPPVVASTQPTPINLPDATPPSTPFDMPAVREATVTPAPTLPIPPVESGPATTVMPPVAPYDAAYDDEADDARFRLSPLLFAGVIGAVLAMVSMFSNMVEIAADVPIDVAADNPFGFRLGTWQAADLGGNLPIAGMIVAVGMIVGATVAAYGRRWGAGLAGGSGAAAAGLALLTLGVAQFPIDAAHALTAVPSEQEFVLSITLDVGYWLQVATAAVGLVVLWASIPHARSDQRRNLNPWVAAFGALATLVATVGPMIPVKQGLFSDNWYLVEAVGEPSQLLVIARLVQLGLFALTGLFGFLIVSRYGLGLVFGGSLVAAWLTISTALDLTGNPVGFAFRNPGATSMEVYGVTIFGIAATLAAALVASAVAVDLSARRR